MNQQQQFLQRLDRIAESYVRLVLSVGHHDADYVDAFYGPQKLKSEVDTERPSLDVIHQRAMSLLRDLAGVHAPNAEEIVRLRHQYLTRQLESLVARTQMLSGKRFTFDEESRVLYDAVAPTYPEAYFQKILSELDILLPGNGSVPQRFDDYKRNFIIPKERIDDVFQAAITEARERTKGHTDLPAKESFTLEYVTGKSWSGYNWYKGSSCSLIQINTDLPISIDRAVDLASHEGYPGHHVYNTLLEKHLVRERNWIEFSVYALFSPQSLIAEGTANYGIEMAFPGDERPAFERSVLFPRAGLDGSQAEQYYRVHALFLKLNYAGNEAARRYLNGEITREEAARWLVDYALFSPERAQQRTKFFDQYRSYVINYNLGQDLVGRYIESRGGTVANPAKRWDEFKKLLASPRLPSGLTAA
jgi:hypothetical protein